MNTWSIVRYPIIAADVLSCSGRKVMVMCERVPMERRGNRTVKLRYWVNWPRSRTRGIWRRKLHSYWRQPLYAADCYKSVILVTLRVEACFVGAKPAVGVWSAYIAGFGFYTV